MSEEKLEECNCCGEPNAECYTFKYKGTTFSEKLLDATLMDTLEIRVCQSCVSKMFRSFSKDK